MVNPVLIRSLFDLAHDDRFQKWSNAKCCRTNREVLESWETFWQGHACVAGVPVSVYNHVLHEIGVTLEIYERTGELDEPRC